MPAGVNREPPDPPRAGRTTLVLGGARSGKSRFAESLLDAHSDRLYVATGQAFDPEMEARIATHRARRDETWRTVEAPTELAAALRADPAPALVDCLTLWLTNLLLADPAPTDPELDARFAALEATLAARPSPTVLVASEVGLGIVPGDALSRRFRDCAGLLHQRLAAVAGDVFLVAAGLPLRLR